MFKDRDQKFVFEDDENGVTIFSVGSIEKDFDETRVRKLARMLQGLADDMIEGRAVDNFDSIMRMVSAGIDIAAEIIPDDISWELPMVVKRHGVYMITRDMRGTDEILHLDDKENDDG